MVLLVCRKEEDERDVEIDGESRSESYTYSLRRTSARVKSRNKPNNKDSPPPPPPPAKRKRSKIDDTAAQSTTTTAATSTTVVAGGDGPSSNDTKGCYAKVTETLRKFNKYYLNFIQAEESRCAKQKADLKAKKESKSKLKSKSEKEDNTKIPSSRPDLKAITEMKKTGAVLYPEKRFGPVRSGLKIYN